MNILKRTARTSIAIFFVSFLSSGLLIFAVSVLMNESRLGEVLALNQWLARDIASQFSGVAAKALSQAQRYGQWVRLDSGTFESVAKSEFDSDSSLKAVWVVDAAGSGASDPLARLEREGFDRATLLGRSAEARPMVDRLIDRALDSGSAAQNLGPGLSAVALRLAGRPRMAIVLFQESFFPRANGGPWGDKWLLVNPSALQDEPVLVEASSELRGDIEYPTFAAIADVLWAATPDASKIERTELSHELVTPRGESFQVSGVQTGAFGIMAIAVTPFSNSAVEWSLLVRLALGLAVTLSFGVGLVQWFRGRRSPPSL